MFTECGGPVLKALLQVASYSISASFLFMTLRLTIYDSEQSSSDFIYDVAIGSLVLFAMPLLILTLNVFRNRQR